jgi:hypothetical protein
MLVAVRAGDAERALAALEVAGQPAARVGAIRARGGPDQPAVTFV